MGRPSYVVGNSWQLHRLSAEERQALDAEPFVFACNLFPEHWRHVGFRPTIWAMGDTHDPVGCSILERQLAAMESDEPLRERLTRLFVCLERPEALPIVDRSKVPVTVYRRGNWTRRDQKLAANLDEPLYHYGSTLTTAVNLALILNPGNEVRLVGCQYGNLGGHFYSTQTGVEDHSELFRHVITRMWQGFSDMVQDGVPLVDCNFEHSASMPGECQIPRKTLLA